MYKKHEVGSNGENVACMFLVKQGFKVIDRNYRRKWGEIDIVATKKGNYHFVEVKTVSREMGTIGFSSVTHETNAHNIRPEENMHYRKIQRLHRVIQTYLIEKSVEGQNWQLDLLVVYLDMKLKKARVKSINNIVL